VLVGREAEKRRLDALLDDARRGRSGALVLRGEAGIGKTALLDLTVGRADGFRVLRAAGMESEAELAYGTLQQLLRPVLDAAAGLPPRQARSLAIAVAVDDGPAPERLAVAAATLSLLAAVAEDRPLLCVVDDAQWLDHASAATLVFVARRLDAEGMVIAFAVREPEKTAFGADGLPDLRVEGIAPIAAKALLADRMPDLAERTANRLVKLARGNPLALLELPRSLTAAELSGRSPLREPLRVGVEIEQAFLGRARALSPEARRALIRVAASEAGDADVLWKTLDDDGLSGQPLAEAARDGLLVPDRLEFCHPLARSAVYQLARPAERRSAHGALAEATVEPDRRAWHLAAAAEGPDEHVAAALETAAEAARRRGGMAAEAKALVRAAELTVDREARARRLLEGALAAEAAGWIENADSLLQDAARLTHDPALHAKAIARRSYLLADRGEFDRAFTLAVDAAERALPKQAAHLLAGGGAFMAVSHRLDIPAALALSERAWQLADPGAADDLAVCEMASRTLVLAGRMEEAASLALSASSRVDDGSVLAIDFATDLLYVEDYPRAREGLEGAVDHARAAEALGTLSYALDQLAKLETRVGNLTRAYALELEALQLAETAVAQAACLVWLSFVEALLGRTESREHAKKALGLARSACDEFNTARAYGALGVEALGRADSANAVKWLEPAVTKIVDGGVGAPNFFRLDSDYIEALVRLGRGEDAQPHLTRLERQAVSTGSCWASATAARLRAFLSPDEEVHERFEAALELHQAEPSAFERARTELCYGERLRRGRRRRDAREQLRAALQTFERVEAGPWAERARIELRATGEHVTRSDPTAAEHLTPQEFQIATFVAEGLTNRDVAARLFLSPKTVEFHLGRVFRKLDIRSRGELIRLFAVHDSQYDHLLGAVRRE